MTTSTKARQAMPAASDIAKHIDAVEDRVIASRQVTLAEVDVQTARLSGATAKARDIEDGITAVSEIQSRWRRGEEVTGAEYADAKLQDDMIVDLAAYLGRSINRLKRNLPRESPVLANHVAPAFGPVVGVEVITTIAQYKEWSENVPADALAVVIVEPLAREVEVNPYTGEQSGKVEVYFFRPGAYRSIRVDDLEAQARELGIAMKVRSNRDADESPWRTVGGNAAQARRDPKATVVDRLTVEVFGALDGLPIVRKPLATSPVKTWCADIFAANSKNEAYTTNRVDVQNPDGKGWRVGYGASAAFGTEPNVSENINDDGERTLAVRSVVNMSGVNVNDFVGALNQRAQQSVGAVDGNGLLAEAEVSLRRSTPTSGMHAADVVLTYRSQVPSGQWTQQRADEARQREDAANQRESRKVEVEDRRAASKRRRHPGEQAMSA